MPSEEFKQMLGGAWEYYGAETPSIERSRAEVLEITQILKPVDDQFQAEHGIEVEYVDVNGIPGAWVSAPNLVDPPVILHLHGGGFILGSIQTYLGFLYRLAHNTKARVLCIDYRLAPENPNPAAIDDSVNAYCWLLNQGVDPQKIVILGDSAGGYLTLATLLIARDTGLPLPATAICLAPVTYLKGTARISPSKDYVDPITRMSVLDLWFNTFEPIPGKIPCSQAPLYADLRGLPRMLIQVGTDENLLEHSVRFAKRAREAEVEVLLEVWGSMIHEWTLYA